jgi:hypothetical protein
VKRYRIRQKTTEANSPWQNQAESKIKELKKLTRRVLRETSTPGQFWCYAIEWASKIRSLTAHDSMILGSRTPEERITGKTPDISEFAHFSWAEWVWYKESGKSFPEADVHLGKWMGVAEDVGQAMTYWVLTQKGTIIARSSVAPLSDIDLRNPAVKDKMDNFIKTCYVAQGGSSSIPIDVFPEAVEEGGEYHAPEADTFTPESFDEYLQAQVVLPVGGELQRGQVTRRLRDQNGNPIGV